MVRRALPPILAVAALVLAVFIASASQPFAPTMQAASTAVPDRVSFQGRVYLSNGQPFNGTGYFRFAVVNAAGSAAYWSNDGTGLSTAPFTPTTAITLSVSNGLFAVQLGATNALTPGVFSGPDRLLRVWFNDELLAPDVALASVPYALNAETLGGVRASGFITAIPTMVPESVTVSSLNSAGVSTHTHAVTSSSNPGAAAALLSSSSAGLLRLSQFGIGANPIPAIGEIFRSSGGIYAASGSYIVDTFRIDVVPWPGNSSASVAGVYIQMPVNATYGNSTGSNIAIQYSASTAGGNNISYLSSMQSGVVHAGSGYLQQAKGATYAIGTSAAGGSITNAYGIDVGITHAGSQTITNAFGWYVVSAANTGAGTIANNYGGYIGAQTSGTFNWALYTNGGTVHLGDNTEVAGNINPTITGTYNLGSSALAWNQINAKQYVTHSYPDISNGVKLRNGVTVSCTVAIAALRPHATQTTTVGLPHMDFTRPDFPAAAYVEARDEWVTRVYTSPQPVAGAGSTPVYDDAGNLRWYEIVERRLIRGEPGADMDVMQSIFLCAAREINTARIALDARADAINARLAALEAFIRSRFPGALP